MIRPEQFSNYPLVREAFDYIQKNYFLYAKTKDFILAHFDEDWLRFGEEMLKLFKTKYPFQQRYWESFQSFIRYSHEFVVLQIELTKKGRYRHTASSEVVKTVYQTGVMEAYYLDGLFLSQVFWPNHYRMCRYFQDQLKHCSPEGKLLEVPCGTGAYLYLAHQALPLVQIQARDVSPYSTQYTKEMLNVGGYHPARIDTGDIFALEEQSPFDYIVCGELLEHLDEPRSLLDKLKSLLKKDGYLFLTTAIFAAAIDHVYLFHTVDEVRDMLTANFEIISELILPTSLEPYHSNMRDVPINYACLLRT